jgi:GAF domain-containing protein
MGSVDGARDPRNVAATLQRLLIGTEGVEEFLTEVAVAAAGAVPSVLACGVSVVKTAWTRVLGGVSNERARQMDAVQYEVDDGPCLSALRRGVLVAVDDIASDGRWPAFARRATQQGVGASLSVPMMVDGAAVGALNLYAPVGGSLSPADRDRAARFADQAAGAVALALRLADREEQNRHLEAALGSRSVIDQAIGAVMARAGVDAATAFEVLQQRSQHSNVKLRDVARSVLDEVTRRPPPR